MARSLENLDTSLDWAKDKVQKSLVEAVKQEEERKRFWNKKVFSVVDCFFMI